MLVVSPCKMLEAIDAAAAEPAEISDDNLFRVLFDSADDDKDGFLTAEQAKAVFVDAALPVNEAELMMMGQSKVTGHQMISFDALNEYARQQQQWLAFCDLASDRMHTRLGLTQSPRHSPVSSNSGSLSSSPISSRAPSQKRFVHKVVSSGKTTSPCGSPLGRPAWIEGVSEMHFSDETSGTLNKATPPQPCAAADGWSYRKLACQNVRASKESMAPSTDVQRERPESF